MPAGAEEEACEVPAGLAVDVVVGEDADADACALAVAVSSGGAEPDDAGDVNSIGAIVNACVGTGAALAEAAGATGCVLCVAFHAKNAMTHTTVAPPMPIAS